MYDMVAMKRQPTQTWWEAVEYTAEDGTVTRSRDMFNAVIDLYGTNVFTSTIREGMSDGLYCRPFHNHNYVDVYSRPAFRKSGESIKIGRVSWSI